MNNYWKYLLPALFFSLFSITAFSQIAYLREGIKGWQKTNSISFMAWTGKFDTEGYCQGYGNLTMGELVEIKPIKEFALYFSGYMDHGRRSGFGKIYNSRTGKVAFDGYWIDDKKNGYGTSYFEDGSIEYKTTFKDDKLEFLSTSQANINAIGKSVVDELFDGGKNITSNLISIQTNESRSKVDECKIKITFDGDHYSSNHYEITVYLDNWNSDMKIDFIDKNSTASNYLAAKGAAKIAATAYKLKRMFN